MTLKTIQKLNHLNQDFYKKVAEPFSHSREQPWAGWQQLLPSIARILDSKKRISILDLGCGNGRFGTFLADNFNPEQISYTGLDASSALLNDAEEKLSDIFKKLQLSEVDLVNELLDQDNSIWLNQKWDLIVCFGVIHHLPSQKLRHLLLQKSATSLQSNGLFILAAWQFLSSQKLKEKSVLPEKVGITGTDLDRNDYILSWDRGVTAYRYCHQVNQSELDEILPTESNMVLDFLADGKENNLNRYLVLEATI